MTEYRMDAVIEVVSYASGKSSQSLKPLGVDELLGKFCLFA